MDWSPEVDRQVELDSFTGISFTGIYIYPTAIFIANLIAPFWFHYNRSKKNNTNLKNILIKF